MFEAGQASWPTSAPSDRTVKYAVPQSEPLTSTSPQGSEGNALVAGVAQQSSFLEPPPEPKPKPGLTTGAKVGIGVAVVVVIAAGVAIYMASKKRKRRR